MRGAGRFRGKLSSCLGSVVGRVLLVLLDEIGDLFEQRGDVVVLDHDAAREVERPRGEVEHALDAGVDDRDDQFVGYARGRR